MREIPTEWKKCILAHISPQLMSLIVLSNPAQLCFVFLQFVFKANANDKIKEHY